jgi:hypothetical protein
MTMTARLQARAVLAAAVLGLALAAAGFFRMLGTALTDYSWGDASYHTQVFYNFTAGHPFQMSAYHNPGFGVRENPAPYANQAAVHVNLTPFLFVPLFSLRPDLYGLYALTIGLVMLSAFAAVLDIFRGSPLPAGETAVRRALALALLFSSSLFRLSHYKGHMLLFAAPFFLGMDAAARRRKIPAYMILAALTALVGEDSAMLVMGHAAYVWLLDRDLRRPAAGAAAVAAAILGVMVFALGPAARFEMIRENGSHTIYYLTHLGFLLTGAKHFLRETRIVMIMLPALAAVRLAFDPGPRSADRRLLALIIVVPAAHWFITMVTSVGVHHLVPPVLCVILAASLLLSDGVPAWNDPVRRKSAIACACLYAALALWNISKDIPRRPTPAQAAESASNRAFVTAVRALVPKNATLVLWCDEPAESFLADRTSFWRFPEFYADADYLALEPGVPNSWVGNPPLLRTPLRETALRPQWGDQFPITAESMTLIKDELVTRAATHEIVRDEPGLLLLKRKVSKPFPVSPSSVGFGYLRNLPGVLRRQ